MTGYGSKKSAGWSMPYEDNVKGIKVFKQPLDGFYVRLSDDTGKELSPQVYLNMTDAETGDLKLKCDTTFKYATGTLTGKWVLLATQKGFWFFEEMANQNGIATNKSGCYLYCGSTSTNTVNAAGCYLTHTGGTWGTSDDDRASLLQLATNLIDNGNTRGKFLNLYDGMVSAVFPQSIFNGCTKNSENTVCSPVLVFAGQEIWALPVLAPSNNVRVNYEIIEAGGRTFINHATGSYQAESNLYVPTDYWELG